MQVIDSLSVLVKNFLIFTKLGKETTPETKRLATSSSPEAYTYFIYGTTAFMKRDYITAVNLFSQALEIDSNFVFASLSLSVAYENQGLCEEAKKWSLGAYERREQMARAGQISRST